MTTEWVGSGMDGYRAKSERRGRSSQSPNGNADKADHPRTPSRLATVPAVLPALPGESVAKKGAGYIFEFLSERLQANIVSGPFYWNSKLSFFPIVLYNEQTKLICSLYRTLL